MEWKLEKSGVLWLLDPMSSVAAGIPGVRISGLSPQASESPGEVGGPSPGTAKSSFLPGGLRLPAEQCMGFRLWLRSELVAVALLLHIHD